MFLYTLILIFPILFPICTFVVNTDFNYILETAQSSGALSHCWSGSEVNYDDRDWHKPHKPPDCIDCVHQSVQKVKQAQAQTQRDTEAGVSETGGHKRQKEH